MTQSEESRQELQVLTMRFRLSYAGFFATHNNLFLCFFSSCMLDTAQE